MSSMPSHHQIHQKFELLHWIMDYVWHQLNGSGNFVPLEVSQIGRLIRGDSRFSRIINHFPISSNVVVIDSGPRYEVAFPSGVSHFVEKLAFHVCLL